MRESISQTNGTIFEPIDRRLEVNVSGLAFTPLDWFELHQASFISIDDKIQGGNIMYKISLYTTGDDPAYDGTLLASFELHVRDPNVAKVGFTNYLSFQYTKQHSIIRYRGPPSLAPSAIEQHLSSCKPLSSPIRALNLINALHKNISIDLLKADYELCNLPIDLISYWLYR